jgi:hypothetical protein
MGRRDQRPRSLPPQQMLHHRSQNMDGRPMSLDPSAFNYARQMLAKGYGYQNACRIAGVNESDLRSLLGTVKSRPSAAPWSHSLRDRRIVPHVPAQPPAEAHGHTRQILQEVADRYGITVADLTSDRRTRFYAFARHEAMARVRKERPHLSLPQIGRIFGGRDHTTVIHALRCHEIRAAWAEVLIALTTDEYQPDLFARAA